MNNAQNDALKLLQDSISALNRGDKEGAWRLARQVIALAPEMEQPWLIMAAAAKPEDSIRLIEKALEINPNSENGIKAFQWAQNRLKAQPIDQESGPLTPKLDESPPGSRQIELEGPAPEPVNPMPAQSVEAINPAEGQNVPLPAGKTGKAIQTAAQKKPAPALKTSERVLLWILLGLFIAGVAGLALLWPDIASLLGFSAPKQTSPNSISTPVPTDSAAALSAAPTPRCVDPTLTLGRFDYVIESIASKPGELPDLPVDDPQTAYWITGTTINYAIILTPTNKNINRMNSQQSGDPVSITWSDCSQEEFTVRSTEHIQPGELDLLEQSTGGVTILVKDESSASILVVRAGYPEVESVESDVIPTDNPVQLDIQLNYDLAAPDAQSLKIGLIITNQGSDTVSLTSTDISLTVEGETPVYPSTIEPGLPVDLVQGESVTLAVTFPKPRANIALLKILDITFDYYVQ